MFNAKIQLKLLAAICAFVTVHGLNKVIKASCKPEDEICSFKLKVSRIETMMLYARGESAKPLIIANNTVYKRKGSACGQLVEATEREVSSVAVADGTIRYIYAINGVFPGPNIVVYEGQTVEISVENLLIQEGLTLHWHGMFQDQTHFMDGVPAVTQCPIGPQDSFTYRFKAAPAGTHWYHSHQGTQLSDGINGAFIVLPKPGKKSEKEGLEYHKDYLMVVQDFYHNETNLVFYSVHDGNGKYLNTGYYSAKQCYRGSSQIDSAELSPIPFTAALINGKGYIGDVNRKGLIEEYPVRQNKRYRFRIINTGMMYALRVSIDGHKLVAFSSDGVDFEPKEVDSIIVSVAERYDFYINADQPIAKYWIRAETMEVLGENERKHEVKAILDYEGSIGAKPSSHSKICTAASPCKVLNCAFREYPVAKHSKCINVGDLHSSADPTAVSDGHVAPPVKDVDEHFLMFSFTQSEDDPEKKRSSVNGIQFRSPTILTKDTGTSKYLKRCDPDSCKKEACYCTHVLQLESKRWIQMVLISRFVEKDGDRGAPHPVHIHSYHFRVVKVGYPVYDNVTKKITAMTPDISCGDQEDQVFCRHPRWSNPSWGGLNIPGLNLKDPVMKDTVQIPAGGYVVVQFWTANPGRWFMHCHFEIHQVGGMALIIQEGTDDEMPKAPPHFPTCGTFRYEQHLDAVGAGKASVSKLGLILGTVLALVVIIAVVIGGVLLYRQWKASSLNRHESGSVFEMLGLVRARKDS